MTDLKQEARMLTLGERMVLAARLAVLEHLRQSVTAVPRIQDIDILKPEELADAESQSSAACAALVGAP
jgi:hypothetical protein